MKTVTIDSMEIRASIICPHCNTRRTKEIDPQSIYCDVVEHISGHTHTEYKITRVCKVCEKKFVVMLWRS